MPPENETDKTKETDKETGKETSKADPRDEQIAMLMKRLEAIEGKSKTKSDDDTGLDEKARKAREDKEKSQSDVRTIESAIKFSIGAREWLKTNATLLPKDFSGILDAADKENFGSAVEKDSAIKSAMVQEFFKLQANLDLLTPSQKTTLDEFQKLTKTGKQEKAVALYEQIFEPTFEMLKRVKKAEQLGKDGHATHSDADAAYRDKMIKLSNKHYLGDKSNA